MSFSRDLIGRRLFANLSEMQNSVEFGKGGLSVSHTHAIKVGAKIKYLCRGKFEDGGKT